MNFTIQAGNPRVINIAEEDVDNISDAIENIFELNTEYVLMVWNYIPILLSYKYDISTIINDILAMLESLRTKEKGAMVINWPSNTFHSFWSMKWDHENIEIESEWTSVIGDTEVLLNNRNNLSIDKVIFSMEWKKLLENVIDGLYNCGFNEELIGMKELVREFKDLSEYGELYRLSEK